MKLVLSELGKESQTLVQTRQCSAVNPALLLILSLSVLIPKCPMLFLYLLLCLRSGGIGQGPDLFFFFF